MKIQIWGKSKCFDTKKAERYFKERRIKVQFIDLKEKEMSKGELTSVMQAVGGIEKLLENQQVLAEPIVRNGKKATVGYQPEIWKTWE